MGSYVEEPRHFRASVGGYFGPSFSVEWQGDQLVYECGDSAENQCRLQVRPTAARWRRFWDVCDRIGVWSWQPSYSPDGLVMDGSSWEVEINSLRGTVLSGGDNAYPPDGDVEETKEFRALCRGHQLSCGTTSVLLRFRRPVSPRRPSPSRRVSRGADRAQGHVGTRRSRDVRPRPLRHLASEPVRLMGTGESRPQKRTRRAKCA